MRGCSRKMIASVFASFAMVLVGRLPIVESSSTAVSHHHHSPARILRNRELLIKNYPQWDDSPKTTIQVRGGGEKSNNDLHLESPKQREKLKIAVASVAIVAALSFAWIFREALSRIFDKQRIQDKTLEILQRLDDLPKLQAYATYTTGMALWEACGLPTIPVETAAGMVFGWKGSALSATGKVIGASCAFVVGRHSFLASWVKAKLSTNKFLQLVEESADHHPLKVTILMKLSCFPETIKNYGSAVLFPIRFWMFTLATIVHGGAFSLLWTYLGVDTAMRLTNPDLPADNLLRILLIFSLINGIVISPSAMAYWVRDLQETGKAHDYK